MDLRKCKALRRRLFWTLMIMPAAAGIIYVTGNGLKDNIVINRTRSLPGLVYLKQPPVDLRRGDIVLVCPQAEIAEVENRLRLTLKNLGGACPAGNEPLIKILAGVPRDLIEADGQSEISINHLPFNGSKPRHDSILPRFRFSGRLDEHSYLLLTPYYDGFDSRYFGWIKQETIMAKLKLIF